MKKRILTLTLVLCMLLSILPVTAMAATVQDLLNELNTTTFSYLYDAQRTPTIPEKAGASFNLHGLDYPLTSTGSRYTYYKSSWTLTSVGSYADFKNTHTPSSSMADIISLVEDAYASANLTADTVLIHELKENGNHVAYGVVIAYTSGSNGYAAFLGDTHYNGTGYFLSKTALDTTQSYDVYANMIATDFVQDIALDTVGTYDFGTKPSGYDASTLSHEFTVTNVGTVATGKMNITVTDSNGHSIDTFIVSPNQLTSIEAQNETRKFTVTPKAGLAAGTYSATITVNGDYVTPKSFNVKFVVSEAPKPVVTLDPTGEIPFNLTEGYTSADVNAKTVTISNTGDGEATGVNILNVNGTTSKGYFAVTTPGTTIAANGTTTFTVAPTVSGLKAGTYTERITIAGSNFDSLTLTLTLTVTAKPSEPVYTPSYAVTAASAEHGAVALSTKNAYAGSAVTVTVTPDEGYALSSLTAATRTGASVALTDLGSGRYRFTMPASDVTVTAVFAAGEKTARFVDVPVGSTFFDAVEWAAAQGITTGTTGTTFSPANACTRGQIVTFLWRAFGSPEPKTAACPFTDVTEDSFCYKAVLWAVENGITTGTTDTTFSPNVPCTRAQAVTLLYRAVGSPAVSGASGFPDVPAGAYCGSAVTWAVEKGVTTGTTDGLFAPGVNCSRGQIVAFLYRALFAQK